MLIIVSKCISIFFKPGHFKDVHYRKYHQHHHWKISCQSVTVATRQHDLSFACLTFERKPIFRCARSFSTLRVQVLWRCCGLSIRPRLPYCRQKSSPTIILWESSGKHDRINITDLNEWCRQIKKKWLGFRTCWRKLQSFFKFSTDFNNSPKF